MRWYRTTVGNEEGKRKIPVWCAEFDEHGREHCTKED